MGSVATAILEAEPASRRPSPSARLLPFPFDPASAQSLEVAEQTLSAEVAGLSCDLTVVVPIYNTRRYVLDTLRSVLLAADRLRIQVICVNDGSTDNSLELVAAFLRQHNCRSALVVDQPNSGLGAARNVALPFACGEYLAFLDSDDLVDIEGYPALLSFGREHDCDVVWGRIRQFPDDLSLQQGFVDVWTWEWILGDKQAVVLFPRIDHRPFMIEAYAGCRIIRTAFFRQHRIRYPDGLYEDVPVLPALLTRAERIGFVNVPLWHYRMNRPGQITQERSQRRLEVIPMFRKALNQMLKNLCSPDHGASFIYMNARMLFWCSPHLPLDLRRKYFEQVCVEFRSVPKSWIDAFFRRFRDLDLPFVVWCLARGEAEGLVRRSAQARTPWLTARFLYRVHGARIVLSFVKATLRRFLGGDPS